MKREGVSVAVVGAAGATFYGQEMGISQSEVEEKCVHLQTVLLLTQLNSAYFEMHLSLRKALAALEQKYFNAKMKAFLKLKAHRRNTFQARLRLQLNNCLKNRLQNGEAAFSAEDSRSLKARQRQAIISFQDGQDRKSKTFLRTVCILKKLANKINSKRASVICSAFYQMLSYQKQPSVLNICSEKPSRIETNDSQKSEANRSKEKRDYRRLYSLQKSKANHKVQQRAEQSSNAGNERNDPKGKNGSELNRLLQKNVNQSNDHKDRLEPSKQKKTLRSFSHRRQNSSLVLNGKQQKIAELQFLKQKYNRLISQFTIFSAKFLRVVQQEQAK